MRIIVSTIAVLSIMLLVVGVQSGVNGFTLWNLAPVFVAYCLILFTHRKGVYAIGALIGAFVAGGTVVLGHLAWYFDWAGTATGSSTAGLTLVLLPILAFLLGLLAFSSGTVISYFRQEVKP